MDGWIKLVVDPGQFSWRSALVDTHHLSLGVPYFSHFFVFPSNFSSHSCNSTLFAAFLSPPHEIAWWSDIKI